jgi:hypothetical protein
MKKLKVYIGEGNLTFQEQIDECEKYYNVLKDMYSKVKLINMQLNNNLNVLGYFEYFIEDE